MLSCTYDFDCKSCTAALAKRCDFAGVKQEVRDAVSLWRDTAVSGGSLGRQSRQQSGCSSACYSPSDTVRDPKRVHIFFWWLRFFRLLLLSFFFLGGGGGWVAM